MQTIGKRGYLFGEIRMSLLPIKLIVVIFTPGSEGINPV
jgi:hypothetical protein